MTGIIKSEEITNILENRFLDYAMSVITDRAIPSIYDGLKPVHRRILWAMNNLGVFSNKSTLKCAKIVGETMGDFHPHGNVSIYGALIRMAQEWVLQNPLIHPQGNIGSIDDSNSFAADRYVEAKLSKISEELLQDLEKEVVDFIPNYSNTKQEPVVLPAKFPNLLVNGSKGIAVGLATEIPTHNLGEILDGLIYYIDNPTATLEELIKLIPGPDFPTGGLIRGKAGIKEMYSTGRGKFQIYSKITEKETKKGDHILYITEVPYGIEKAALIDQINGLLKPDPENPTRPVLEGIDKCVDESGKEISRDFKIAIYLKDDANTQVVKNQLYQYTNTRISYNSNIVALDKQNKPLTLGLMQIFAQFLAFRKDCLKRKFNWEKDRAEKRKHLLEGYLVIIKDIDKAIKLIKAASSTADAKTQLIATFSLSSEQADAILELQLRRLTALEVTKIQNDLAALTVEVNRLTQLLTQDKTLLDYLKAELVEIKTRFATPRLTKIQEGELVEFDMEDLINQQDCVITISHKGYINRISTEDYRMQKRGGKGSVGAGLIEGDYIEEILTSTSLSYLLCFSNLGKLYWLKAYQIPVGKRGSKGKPVINYLPKVAINETIEAVVMVPNLEAIKCLLMVSKKGFLKKMHLSLFKKPRNGGVQAFNLDAGDVLAKVLLVDDNGDFVVGTRQGLYVRREVNKVRNIKSRGSKGNSTIKLKDDDEVVGLVWGTSEQRLLAVTAKGIGKQSSLEEYRIIKGKKGSGNKLLKLEQNDQLVSLLSIDEADKIMMLSEKGKSILFNSSDLRKTGRVSRGVQVFELDDDLVKTVTKIKQEEELNS